MIAWSPDDATRGRAQLTRFLRDTGHNDFASMYAWSIAEPGPFTEAVLRFLDMPFHRPYDTILDSSRGPEWPLWCVNGRLNIANACLRHDPSRPAVVWEGEEGATRSLTYGELNGGGLQPARDLSPAAAAELKLRAG